MKYFFLTFLAFLTFLTATQSYAIQEFESVITDQKFNSSSSIVIDEKQIEESHVQDVPSLLSTQANISISQGNFVPNSIFLRGGNSGHVLILIDGVPAYDASTPDRTLNLGSLNLKSVRSIEVVKGSQSVLFGGQALSGVIKIETIPQELKDKGSLELEAGTSENHQAQATGLKTFGNNSAVIARGHYAEQKNESPILNSDQTYPTRVGSGEIGFLNRGDNVETLVKAFTSFDRTFIASTDATGWFAADADNFVTSSYQLNVTGRFKSTKSAWSPVLTVSQQKSERAYEQEDPTVPTKRELNGSSIVSRLEVTPVQSKQFKLLGGLSYALEKFDYYEMNVKQSDETSEFQGVFLKGEYNLSENLGLEAGARSDFRKLKNAVSTYQVGVTAFKDFKAEYSTGFKFPSLSQLFGAYGNQDLQPERSNSVSLSYDKNINEQTSASVTLFDTYFFNLFTTRGSPPKIYNIASSRTKGVEFTGAWQNQEKDLTVSLLSLYQEPRDLDIAEWLPMRPLQRHTFRVQKQMSRVNGAVEVVHSGERRAKSGPGTLNYTTLESFTLLNATVEYKHNEELSYFFRGDNLMDKRYQSSFTYYSSGRELSAGVELEF